MSTETVPRNHSLKRLQFVHSTATYLGSYAQTAEAAYSKLKGVLPGAVQPKLHTIEQTVSSYAAPWAARVQDAGEKVLHLADEQVDFVLSTADKTYSSGKDNVKKGVDSVLQIHQSNVKTFSETSAAYYEWVQQVADWAKDKLNPVKGGQAAVDTLTAAIQKAKEATDPDVAAKMATDAWNSFASLPVVAKALDTADPVTRRALNAFYAAHDQLVRLSLYRSVVQKGASTLSWASSTTPYKLGATYVYPLVQPVADPTLDKLSHSRVIQQTVDYWKPTAIAA